MAPTNRPDRRTPGNTPSRSNVLSGSIQSPSSGTQSARARRLLKRGVDAATNAASKRAETSHAQYVSTGDYPTSEADVDKAQIFQPALNLSSSQLQADETMSLFPHRPDSVHSAEEGGLSHDLLQRLQAEIQEHKQNDNRGYIQAAIDDLDRAILLTDPGDELYRSAIEHLRHWCRTSGELPASSQIEDIVDFDIRCPLSSTGLSDVYKGVFVGVQVAVKILRLHEDNRSRAQIAFRNEVVTWKCLRHPNIVPFLGTSSISPVCLVSEWMPEGTLFAFLERNPKEHRVRYINHILQGLDFMHRLGVIHGDLKAVNVLVDDGKMARLADFGVATMLHNSTIAATTMNGNGMGGTVRWQAPELLGCFDSEGEDPVRPSIPTDVYSLAITLWELFTLLAPFPHVRADNGVLIRVLKGERPTKPTDCEDVGFSDTLWDVMQRGWDAKAELRPPLAEFALALGGTLEAPVLA